MLSAHRRQGQAALVVPQALRRGVTLQKRKIARPSCSLGQMDGRMTREIEGRAKPMVPVLQLVRPAAAKRVLEVAFLHQGHNQALERSEDWPSSWAQVGRQLRGRWLDRCRRSGFKAAAGSCAGGPQCTLHRPCQATRRRTHARPRARLHARKPHFPSTGVACPLAMAHPCPSLLGKTHSC